MSTKDELYRSRGYWDFCIPVVGTFWTLNYLSDFKTASKFTQAAAILTGFTGTAITTYLSHKNYTDRINK